MMSMSDKEYFTFDDVLILPQFSEIYSRKDVDISSFGLTLPILSSNMDTITEVDMAIAMAENGGMGVLHRFMDIDKNLEMFRKVKEKVNSVAISVGITEKEYERAEALIDNGADQIVIDVAHGAQLSVVNMVNFLRKKYNDNIFIIAGNFATGKSIRDFNRHLGVQRPNAYKVNVGAGAVCSTRLKTGVGMPQLSAIIDCANEGVEVVADGGMKSPGDACKAFMAGAKAIMMGSPLSATLETPGDLYDSKGIKVNSDYITNEKLFKKYRGSASKESYEDQGKLSDWRTAEGVSTLVPCKGSVTEVLKDYEGGLRSSLTYVGAKNLTEYKERGTFIKVSNSTVIENGTHGVK